MKHSKVTFNLDLGDIISGISIPIKKTAKVLNIILMENGQPYEIEKDCKVVFYAKKPDGDVLYNDCIVKDNVVEYQLTTQTIALAGIVECELLVYGEDSSTPIHSPSFSLVNYEPVFDGGEAIESTNEFTALTQAMGTLETLIDQAKEVVNSKSDDYTIHTPNYISSNATPFDIKFGTHVCAVTEFDSTLPESNEEYTVQGTLEVIKAFDSIDCIRMYWYPCGSHNVYSRLPVSDKNWSEWETAESGGGVAESVVNKKIATAKSELIGGADDLTDADTIHAAKNLARGLVNGLEGKVVKTADLNNAINSALSQAKESGKFDGADGLSAYEIWLSQGNTGSEADFLESLKGDPGVSLVFRYATLSSAIADVESESFENEIVDDEEAFVEVFSSGGIKTIVLLKDLLEKSQINITKSVNIDLNGKTLSFESSAAYIQASSESLEISNGSIFVDISGGVPSVGLIRCTSGHLIMNNVSIKVIGGVSSQFIGLFFQNTNGVYDIKNCNIDVKNNLNAAVAIYHYKGILNIENTSIMADTDSAKQTYGLLNSDRANIIDSIIFADAPDNSVDRNGYSIGILNNKVLYATNTNVSGTHSGLSTTGSAYISGGVYDSCSHGGMYIYNNGQGETFVKDATIRCGDYTGVHDSTLFSNAKLAALYFGESSDSSNGEVAYFDGCTIEAVGANHVIALRDSHGDNINVFNISNSTISKGSNYIRTDGMTVKVNIGVGTNITKDRLYVDANYEYTNEMYRRFGEEEKVSGADANALVLSAITAEKVNSLLFEKSKQEHPVNSIFPSMSKTNPAEIFGFGEWELIGKDRFLLGAGDKYEVGAEGGEETHTLTIEEMPSHTHIFQATQWADKTGDIKDNGDTEYIDYEKNRQTQATGGSKPHNNMPPYIAVYFWLRTK